MKTMYFFFDLFTKLKASGVLSVTNTLVTSGYSAGKSAKRGKEGTKKSVIDADNSQIQNAVKLYYHALRLLQQECFIVLSTITHTFTSDIKTNQY